MRRYRGKAIAFGLVALVGATSTSLADAAEGLGSAPGPVLPMPSTSPSLGDTTAAGSTARKTVQHLGDPLEVADQLLGRLSFASPRQQPASGSHGGAAPRKPLVELVGESVAAGTITVRGAAGGAGGTSLFQPTLSRVMNVISATTASTVVPAAATSPGALAGAPPAIQGPPAPGVVLALQAGEQADEQSHEPTDELATGTDELAAAAHAARTEEAFQARPDAALAIAASVPQYVERPHVPGAPSDAALEQLRWCESGGNYSSVSSGGWYRGAYQFDFSTWDSVASRWMPHLVGTDPAAAAPADQDLLASALFSERGWQPWPNCGLGL